MSQASGIINALLSLRHLLVELLVIQLPLGQRHARGGSLPTRYPFGRKPLPKQIGHSALGLKQRSPLHATSRHFDQLQDPQKLSPCVACCHLSLAELGTLLPHRAVSKSRPSPGATAIPKCSGGDPICTMQSGTCCQTQPTRATHALARPARYPSALLHTLQPARQQLGARQQPAQPQRRLVLVAAAAAAAPEKPKAKKKVRGAPRWPLRCPCRLYILRARCRPSRRCRADPAPSLAAAPPPPPRCSPPSPLCGWRGRRT